MFEWSGELEVGVPEIDRDHRSLLCQARVLDEAVKANDPGISRELGALILITEAHFRWEEGSMREHGYEGYGGHKADHDHLLKQIYTLRDELAAGRVDVSSSLLTLFIQVWTRKHIVERDRAYASYLRSSVQPS